MTGDQHIEKSKPTSTRRNALKLAAGAITAATLGTAPATAQRQDRLQWTSGTGRSIFSSPTVVNDTVYVGSWDGNLYAVDAKTGGQDWMFSTGDRIWSSPTVINGTVYAGSYDQNLYALDANTGDQQWVFEAAQIRTAPTVSDGTVYCTSLDGRIYAVDAETGTQQWVFETGGIVFSSPTVDEGTVFVGSGDNNLYAVDTETGTRQWQYGAGDSVLSSPTVTDGTVFVGSSGDTFHAVGAESGNKIWEFSTNGHATSSPTVADGVVFAGSEDNKLYAIDAETGTQQWEFKTEGPIYSSPTVVEGTVFVGSYDNNLYAIDADVETSSEGSRVKLKTLGHHDVNLDDGGDEQNLFNLTVDGPSEAVAGSDVTISVDAVAAQSQISAFQIAPREQPDHANDFSNQTVTTTAATQIQEPGFVVYNELQDQVIVEWTGTIPDTAEPGETFTLAGDALDGPQNRQLFSQTVTVTDDPLAKYRNENGKVNDMGLLEAISDWRDDQLEDTQLLQLISEWRDAGGNVETLPAGSLPNVK